MTTTPCGAPTRERRTAASPTGVLEDADLSTGPDNANRPGAVMFDPEGSAQFRTAVELRSRIAAPAVLRAREEIASLFAEIGRITTTGRDGGRDERGTPTS